MNAAEERRLLEELVAKQELLVQMQSKLAALQRLVADSNEAGNGGLASEYSLSSSASSVYQDVIPPSDQDEQLMLDYLEQLEQQRRDVISLMSVSRQSRCGSSLAGSQRCKISESSARRAASETAARRGRNDGFVQNSRRSKLVELRQSVTQHIEDNLSQLYMLEKYARTTGIQSRCVDVEEMSDELKVRLVNLFKIKDEVDEMLSFTNDRKFKPTDSDHSPVNSGHCSPAAAIDQNDILVSLQPEARMSVQEKESSTDYYENLVGEMRARDQDLDVFESKLGFAEITDDDYVSENLENSEKTVSDLKEVMMDDLLAFVQSNSDDPYFVLNTFQHLRRIQPFQRSALLAAISTVNGNDESSENGATEFDGEENAAATAAAEKLMTLDMLRQFQRFTMEILCQRYDIDSETEGMLEKMVEKLILGYIGLDANGFMDEMLEGLNEILLQVDLQPRKAVIEAERSFAEESFQNEETIDNYQQQIIREECQLDAATQNAEWVEAVASNNPTSAATAIAEDSAPQISGNLDGSVGAVETNWVSTTQTTAVEFDERQTATVFESSEEGEETAKFIGTKKRSLSMEQLRDLKQQVEAELTRDDADFDRLTIKELFILKNANEYKTVIGCPVQFDRDTKMISRQKAAVIVCAAAGGIAGYKYFQKSRNSLPVLHQSNESYAPVRVISVDQQTPTVYRIRLALPPNQQPLPMLIDPTGQTLVYVNIKENLSQSYRSFTPVFTSASTNAPESPTEMDLYVKRYVYPRGEVARHIIDTLPGEAVEVHGPHASYRYEQQRTAVNQNQQPQRRRIHMIAGGTGVLPMLQLFQLVDRLPTDNSLLNLMFLNRDPREVFLHRELTDWQRKLAEKNPLTVSYVVDQKTVGGISDLPVLHEGPLTEPLLRQCLFNEDQKLVGETDLLLVCGPPGLYRHLGIHPAAAPGSQRVFMTASSPLRRIGFNEKQIILFHDQAVPPPSVPLSSAASQSP